jgi:hypothetical protein
MTMPLGSATITLGKTGYFQTPFTGLKGLIIGNESPYTLNVTVGLGLSKTLYPETVDFFSVGSGFNGNITFIPSGVLTNPSSYTATTITFDAVGINEPIDISVYPISLTRPAINPTATGQPVYTAWAGTSSSAGVVQTLNVFNPANSGVIGIFHSANLFTNSIGIPQSILAYIIGADLNLANSTTAIPHIITPGTRISSMHVTWDDVAVGHGGTIMENARVGGNGTTHGVDTLDLIKFPDVVYLYPGANLLAVISDTASGNVTALSLKWTEQVATPPIIVQGAKAVASSIQNDGSSLATQWLEVTPTGFGSSAIVSTVDGQLTWKVVSGGVYHQALKIASAANFLQLGQAGDITEVLGQLTVDQLVTLVGNLIAGGGINVNTIRDNVSGTSQITLTTAGITILNPLQAALKFLTGSLSRINMIGSTAIAVAGTAVNHGLSVVPTFVLPVGDTGASSPTVCTINYGTMTTTQFTAFAEAAGNFRFLVGAF